MAVAFATSSTATTSSNASTLSINAPASLVDNEFMLMAVETVPISQGGPTVTAPAGWNAYSFSPVNGGTGSALWVWWKIASGEGSSYSISFNVTALPVEALIARYTGVDRFAPNGNSSTATGSGVTTVAVAAPTGIKTGGVSVMIGGARPDSSTTSLTITLPSSSRVASFYTGSGFGAVLALSDSTSTASGNMTISASVEASQATIVLNPSPGFLQPTIFGTVW